MKGTDIEALRIKNLCHQCVGEVYLSDEIRKNGKRSKCSYCGNIEMTQSLEVLSERIGEVFAEHYILTSDQSTGFDWKRKGERITGAIMDAVGISEAEASDIQRILEDEHQCSDSDYIGEESEFSSESYYEEKETSDWYWQEQWRNFEKSIKAESRYFNQFASDHLSMVFESIDNMKTSDNRDLVIEVGPGKSISAFYRARAFQSDETLVVALKRPDIHLGPPPSRLATAGRMNARGISVFYGATDPHVALAEVRPPVGSQVAIAHFEITRPIRLLDLTALSKVVKRGSIFNPADCREFERAMFLRSLSDRIAKAVMPDDEALEYIATQAVADFLAARTKVPIDGILFPSVQTGGQAQNVVLFQKASRVEPMDIPHGTRIDVRLQSMTDEGPEPDYVVIEDVPQKKKLKCSRGSSVRASALPTVSSEDMVDPSSDGRGITLKLVPDSVRVHIVKGVQHQTEEYVVNRHRCRPLKGQE